MAVFELYWSDPFSTSMIMGRGVVYTLHPINRRQYMHDDGRWRNGFALQTNILLSGYSSFSTGNTPPTGLLFIAIIDYRRVDDSGIFVHLLFRSATIKTTLKPRISLDICPKKPQYCSHLFTVSKGKNHTRTSMTHVGNFTSLCSIKFYIMVVLPMISTL